MTIRTLRTAPLLAVLSLSACAKKDDKPAAEPAKSTSYACTATVSKATDAQPLEAMASGEDEAKVRADAWAQVCAKLPAEAQAGCAPEKAPDGWTWSGGGGSSESGGKKLYSSNVTLTPLAKTFSGKGSSTTSDVEACDAAYAEACKGAGAAAGCQTAPGFTDNGVAKSSTSIGLR